MATIGNLELRFHDTALYASTTHEGYRVYEAIPQLALFLDSVRNPIKEKFESWFRKTSKELLPYEYCTELLGGAPEEVIMDIPRRLILHTGDDGEYLFVGDYFQEQLEEASARLRERHNFQIIKYIRPEVRTEMRVMTSRLD